MVERLILIGVDHHRILTVLRPPPISDATTYDGSYDGQEQKYACTDNVPQPPVPVVVILVALCLQVGAGDSRAVSVVVAAPLRAVLRITG